MSARPMLSHVKASDGLMALMPKNVTKAAVYAAARAAEVKSSWLALEDLETQLSPNQVEVVITNPPYSKVLEGTNAAGRRNLNPNYWRKVIKLAHVVLKEGGYLVLIAPITPDVKFDGYELVEYHNEHAVEFLDEEGNGVYTKSCWVVLRKVVGASCYVPFKPWAMFPELTLAYEKPLPANYRLVDLSKPVVTGVGSRYNTNKVIITGPESELQRFEDWGNSAEGQKVFARIRGGDYMRVSIARARLGMKK